MEQKNIDLLVNVRKNNPKGWKKWLTGKNQTSLLQELEKEVPIPKTLSEKIVWLRDNLTDYPKCPVCGKTIQSFDKEYSKFCSCKCAQNSKETREKCKETCKKIYGTENPAQSKIVQDKMKHTCLERYGAENIFGSEVGKEKIKESCLKIFGTENPMQSDTVKSKQEKTMISRFGKKCIAGDFVKHESKGELELFEFIKTIYPKAKHSDHSWIFPMELDISLKELNLAFEYDGDYWHSLPDMIERDRQKDLICKQKGICLFRVKENDWKKNKLKICNEIKEKIECLI